MITAVITVMMTIMIPITIARMITIMIAMYSLRMISYSMMIIMVVYILSIIHTMTAMMTLD